MTTSITEILRGFVLVCGVFKITFIFNMFLFYSGPVLIMNFSIHVLFWNFTTRQYTGILHLIHFLIFTTLKVLEFI